MTFFEIILLLAIAVPLVVVLVAFSVPAAAGLAKALRWVGVQVGLYIGRSVRDLGRIFACVLVAPIFAMLALVSLVFLQRGAAAKFGRALRDEGARCLVAFYRLVLANPMRLLGLSTALEGLEERLPSVLTGTWGEVVSPRTGLFPGYAIIGTLPGGGSGAKLFIAQPTKAKQREFRKHLPAGAELPQRVVLKSFSTLGEAGLPAIVRESRALEAGTRLGLILDHGLAGDRFFYATRYVPGDALNVVIDRLHAQAGPDGLDAPRLRGALLLVRDLLVTLAEYHAAGVWHKDVKPDNIIVDAPAPTQGEPAQAPPRRAHLVDLGLISPLRSALTLTTHGTEYYRDPELVRRALRGVRVQDVDGARFDVYAAGAVLYAVVEGTFPAQGVLSPISKRCPAAIAWIIRRAMADYDQRYASVEAMRLDLDAALAQTDLEHAKPADLPSVSNTQEAPPVPSDAAREQLPIVTDSASRELASASPQPNTGDNTLGQPLTAGPAPSPAGLRVVVTNWWTGTYRVE